MKITKEGCLLLGKEYVLNYGCYPSSKKWNIKTAGCSKDRIYELWNSWPSFIEELRAIIDIGEYKGSSWNKGSITSQIYLKDRKCANCENIFHSYKKEQKYCSLTCAYTSPKMGGVREGSGRSKTGYCEGIYCGSTYELAWVIYNLDNNISFTRCNKVFFYDSKKYYPDFIQNGNIIEIKGFWTDEVEAKKKAVIDAGYNIQILYKEDLKHCFNWIKDNYDVPIETLFDSYATKFNYHCNYCNTEFTTNKRRTTEITYCSRKCSGNGVVNRKKPNERTIPSIS